MTDSLTITLPAKRKRKSRGRRHRISKLTNQPLRKWSSARTRLVPVHSPSKRPITLPTLTLPEVGEEL